MGGLQTITFGFRVPEDEDYPSERLARTKQLIIDAVNHQVMEHANQHNREDLELLELLLTES